LDWWVDAEEYSIIDMEKDVFKHFSWASYQEANFWFVGQNNRTVRLGNNQELLAFLRASKMVEFIMTIDRCQHVDMALTVTEMENEKQVSDEENQGPAEGNDMQLQVTDMFQGMHLSVELNGLEWALQPQLGVTAAGPSRVEEEEDDHYMEPGLDHEGDNPVGADEEWRYFNKVHEEGSKEKV